jgi:hypothetical protein
VQDEILNSTSLLLFSEFVSGIFGQICLLPYFRLSRLYIAHPIVSYHVFAVFSCP